MADLHGLSGLKVVKPPQLPDSVTSVTPSFGPKRTIQLQIQGFTPNMEIIAESINKDCIMSRYFNGLYAQFKGF